MVMKQTEIGVIPEDWEVGVFEDFSDKSKKWSITGGPFGSNLKTDDYTSDGVQIIQLQNIGDGYFNNESQVFTSIKKADELISCNIYPGEIILSKMGDPVARACVIPNHQKRFLMASDGIRLLVDKKKFDNSFVFHYINSPFFRNRAIEISTGSTRQRIGLPELKKLGIIKPTLAEQEAIANALSDADAWIEKLEQLIAKKRLIKQGAMQELLTPKDDWEVKKLGEVCEIKRGQIITSSIRVDGNIPVIAGGKTPAYYHNKSNRKGKTITISASGASAGYVGFHNYPIFASDCSTISESEKYSIEFIFYFLQRNQDVIYSYQTGGAQPHIHPKDIEPMLIGIPSLSEQERIATILSDMDAEIEALEQQLGKARHIKHGMMQELLTGRTRLV